MPVTIRLPDVGLSRGSGMVTDFDLRKAQFGDGYEQVAAAGLNNHKRRYRCVYSAITVADAASLLAFVRARGGHEPFLFRPPEETVDIQWRCERFSGPSWVSATHRDMELELIEDFTP